MSSPNTSEKSVYLDREEHEHKGEVGAKRVVMYTYDSETDTLLPYSSSGGGDITLQDLVDELSTIANKLSFLAQVQGIASDLRVTLLGGTTAVTTVATLTNQTNIGGYAATNTIMNQMNTNANQLRDRIVVS